MPANVDFDQSSDVLKRQSRERVLDTSFLYEELKAQFLKEGRQVEVDFRKLVHWVKLGDQYTHQIHPYPAKLLPNIAHFFVNASCLRGKGSVVLDPFCGSGTVALEASLAGLIPYVADANPFALLITKVKTVSYDESALEDRLMKIVSNYDEALSYPKVSVVNQSHWYSESRKASLDKLCSVIEDVEDDDERSFFQICFTLIARKLSYSDPAVSVPVKLKPKEKFSERVNQKIIEKLKWIDSASTKEEFYRAAMLNIERVRKANDYFPKRKQAKVVGKDAKSLMIDQKRLKSGSVPLIVTSPPYGSAQKYVRSSSLSLNWLNIAAPSGLSALEGVSIGREHLPRNKGFEESEALPSHFENLLLKVKTKNELREKITRCYLLEMRQALKEMARVLSPNGRIVIIIGNNQVCGETLRNDEFVREILTGEGLNLELNLIDHIKSRGLMTKRNKTASVISREVVLVFGK